MIEQKIIIDINFCIVTVIIRCNLINNYLSISTYILIVQKYHKNQREMVLFLYTR